MRWDHEEFSRRLMETMTPEQAKTHKMRLRCAELRGTLQDVLSVIRAETNLPNLSPVFRASIDRAKAMLEKTDDAR